MATKCWELSTVPSNTSTWVHGSTMCRSWPFSFPTTCLTRKGMPNLMWAIARPKADSGGMRWYGMEWTIWTSSPFTTFQTGEKNDANCSTLEVWRFRQIDRLASKADRKVSISELPELDSEVLYSSLDWVELSTVAALSHVSLPFQLQIASALASESNWKQSETSSKHAPIMSYS